MAVKYGQGGIPKRGMVGGRCGSVRLADVTSSGAAEGAEDGAREDEVFCGACGGRAAEEAGAQHSRQATRRPCRPSAQSSV